MPVPDVVVTVTYATPLYVGSSLTLTCTVTLDPNVDNNETVTTTWSGPSNITGERYLVTATSGSGSTYTSNLTIRYLANQDDGTYTCTGMVTGENEQQVTSSDSHAIPTIRKPQFIFLSLWKYLVCATVSDTMRQSTSLTAM